MKTNGQETIVNKISATGQKKIIAELEKLLERAKTGEFSRIPNGKENTTLSLMDELSRLNQEAINKTYNS